MNVILSEAKNLVGEKILQSLRSFRMTGKYFQTTSIQGIG